MAKRKLSPYEKQKKATWSAFSIYIRTRDAKKYQKLHPETTDLAQCFTCDKILPIKSLQAGHFLAGRNNAVLFDERQVYAQCYGCNCGRGGNYTKYTLKMLDLFGRGFVDNCLRVKSNAVKFTIEELSEKEKYYITKTKELQDGTLDI